MRKNIILLLAALLVWIPACGKKEEPAPVSESTTPAAPAVAYDVSAGGTVTGKVNFEGEKPRARTIRMDQDKFCAGEHPTGVAVEDVVVNDNNTLRNVLVYVKSGAESRTFSPPTESVKLDQKGCLYQPHVLSVMKGQTVDVVNSDNTTHNVNVLATSNRPWNKSQAPNQKDAETFPREEITIPLKCNVHPWMKAYIAVLSHPFHAVTREDGTFELKGLPPGDYEIEAWHEKYGAKTEKVTVAAKESKTVDFTFKP